MGVLTPAVHVHWWKSYLDWQRCTSYRRPSNAHMGHPGHGHRAWKAQHPSTLPKAKPHCRNLIARYAFQSQWVMLHRVMRGWGSRRIASAVLLHGYCMAFHDRVTPALPAAVCQLPLSTNQTAACAVRALQHCGHPTHHPHPPLPLPSSGLAAGSAAVVLH